MILGEGLWLLPFHYCNCLLLQWSCLMNKSTVKKKNVFLWHSKDTMQESLSEILRDMNLNIIPLESFLENKSDGKFKNLDIIIVDLELPECQGITLIRLSTKVKPQIKIIAICNRVTTPVYMRMSKLGVGRILERPLKKATFRDAVLQVFLSSNPNHPQSLDRQEFIDESENHFFLVAHYDNNLYKQIYDTSISEGNKMYISLNEEDFITKVQTGFYDVIFSSYEFMNSIASQKNLDTIFYDTTKPLLFLLDDCQKKNHKNIFSSFPFVEYLSPSPDKDEIIKALQETIPRYEKYKDKEKQIQEDHPKPKKVAKNKNEEEKNITWIGRIHNRLKKSFIYFYLSIIAILALIGFLINISMSLNENIDNPLKNNPKKLINNLKPEQLRNLKNQYENNLDPKQLKKLK